ncbi:MAG: metallophosphoesterase, partial [Spongiibacteraceae bacterium]
MRVVLHISDLHFGTERLPVMHALQAWVRTEKPDLLIVSGDITQRARSAQFRAAAEYIGSLSVPARLVIPGNHDIPLFNVFARLLQPFGKFQGVFGTDLEPEFESNELLVLCVNSTRPERHKHGAVTVDQIERVAERLRAAAPRQLRMVVMHHPVLAITAGDQINLLRGHAAATRIW